MARFLFDLLQNLPPFGAWGQDISGDAHDLPTMVGRDSVEPRSFREERK